MPFLRAGHRWPPRFTGILGWTRPAGGYRWHYQPAQLVCFRREVYAWLHHARTPQFLAWGDYCFFGSYWAFELPDEWQYDLPRSHLETRRQFGRDPAWLK